MNGSWICSYLFNQCISVLKFLIRILLMSSCIRCNNVCQSVILFFLALSLYIKKFTTYYVGNPDGDFGTGTKMLRG